MTQQPHSMKKLFLHAAAFMLLGGFLPSPLTGETPTQMPNNQTVDRNSSDLRIFLGAGYGKRTWKFQSSPSMQQTMTYESFALEHLKPDAFFWRVSFLHGGGKTETFWYDHESQFEGHLGYSFTLEDYPYFSLTPFVGLGYFTNPEWDYGTSFKETYTYVPAGLLVSWQAMPNLNLGLRAWADLPLNKKLKINEVDIPITKKTLWRAELPIVYAFHERWALAMIPFWHIDPNANYLPGSGYDWGAISACGVRLELGLSL